MDQIGQRTSPFDSFPECGNVILVQNRLIPHLSEDFNVEAKMSLSPNFWAMLVTVRSKIANLPYRPRRDHSCWMWPAHSTANKYSRTSDELRQIMIPKDRGIFIPTMWVSAISLTLVACHSHIPSSRVLCLRAATSIARPDTKGHTGLCRRM